MAEQTICILGGTGFVGTRLAAALARAGYNLRVPSRNLPRGRHLLVLPSLQLMQADVHDPARLREALEGCHMAINLIGILNERGRRGDGFRRVHTELAGKLVEACRETGVARLLHMSSLKASAERGPSHYLRTKGEAENLVRSQDPSALAWTVFQPAPIFGPRDTFTLRFARLLGLLPILPLARPGARFAPVYIDDVVRAFVTCANDPRTAGQIYQLCGPETYTLLDIVRMVARATGRRRLVIGLPDFLGRLQGRVMDFVPGKPFSSDNYLSLTVDTVCTENGLQKLGVRAHSLKGVLPSYLHPVPGRSRAAPPAEHRAHRPAQQAR